MLRNLIVFFCLIAIHQLSFADSCPSIQTIQHGALKQWQLYDSDNHQLLSKNNMPEFKKYAKQFALAEWHQEKNHLNTLRCYYRDEDGSLARAYLGKKNLNPKLANNSWYSVSGAMHCAASRDQCSFQSRQMPQQFAKK